jgi:hypothetical protein
MLEDIEKHIGDVVGFTVENILDFQTGLLGSI